MADLHNQHDRIFRKYFRRPDVARSFVEHYVPGEVVALLDLDSLEVQADSFIDDELVGHYSDLLYVSGGKAEFSPEELKEAVDKIFEGETEMQTFFEKQLEQAHQEGVQEGEQIGLTKGRQEGIQKGERQTHIKNIKQILAIRFRVERENYDALLREQSLPQLEALLRVALTVADVAEFEAALTTQQDEAGDEAS